MLRGVQWQGLRAECLGFKGHKRFQVSLRKSADSKTLEHFKLEILSPEFEE